tara:strand:+ start:119 stop:589 length:471 start_codon:yes stop_codon:yes gene_type:complete
MESGNLFDSFINIFNKSKSENIEKNTDEHLMIFSGVLVEAAAIDGKIDKEEIIKIKNSISILFQVSDEKSSQILNESLKKENEPNSLHYFTSRINKEFEHEKKIKLIEVLWEIILADGKIHDFESNLIRRLSGLLYITDVDCGNAKKRVLANIDKG